MQRRQFGRLAAGLGLGLPALEAAAQPTGDWPSRPLTMLVAFAAGGPSDIVARSLAGRMAATLGQPVVAENRPGANGSVAARLLARAAPDGYTLLTGSIGTFAINAALRPNLGYDPVKDFAPITLAVTTPNVLVVNPQAVPATDLPSLIAWMKANRAGYASSGVGSSDHLTMELFRLLTGTEAVHVPYSGSAPALVDLVAGNVHISFQNLGSASPHISSGRLRAIMITSARRHPLFPNVPTTAEAGLRDFVVTSWQAVMAPAGLPPAIQARLHDSAAAALKHPETIARMAQIGFDVVAGTPAECSAFQQAELARWRHVVETAGIKPE